MEQWALATSWWTQVQFHQHRAYIRKLRAFVSTYAWEGVIEFDHTFRALEACGEIEHFDIGRPDLVMTILLPHLLSAKQQAPRRAAKPTSPKAAKKAHTKTKAKTSSKAGTSSALCNKFLAGLCRRGDKCHYKHA